MMHSNQGRISVGILLILAVVVATTGIYLISNHADAAALSKVKATLTTSAPAASSSMTIQFVTPTGVSGTGDKTITVEIDTSATAFSLPDGYSYSDVDLATSSDTTCSSGASFSDVNLGPASSTSQWKASFATNTDILTLTYPGGGNSNTTIGAGTCVQIEIGAVATASTTGTAFTQPAKVAAVGTADVYTIGLGGTFGDSGNAMVAIIEGVTVSATITESLSFSMAGVASTSCTGDSGSPAVRDTTTTTIPFGTLSGANTFFTGCHLLTISTNASSGFSTTIEEDTNLRTSGGVNIPDTTCDNATCSHTATDTWATATNNGFGFACENVSGNGLCTLNPNGATIYKQLACQGTDAQCDPGTGAETKQTFMTTSSPVSAQSTRLHYKLSVSGTQAAGSYSNIVTYIATPVF